MSEISAAAVMKLRNRTGAPMMDCKAALTEAGGDEEKAVEIMRKKSAGIQAKKADRETAEGRIAVFIDAEKKVGSIVEMRCESAPVVKSDQFIALTNQVAKQIDLWGALAWVHRFGSTTAGVSGTVVGLGAVTTPGTAAATDWAEITAGLEMPVLDGAATVDASLTASIYPTGPLAQGRIGFFHPL